MSNAPQTTQNGSPVQRLKEVVHMPSVQEQFRNAMGDNSGLFTASLIDVYANDNYLQKCEPRDVVMEALKAATLKLPINRNLGFAWIIPRWNSKQKKFVPSFQPGWKGIVQLAQRTGQYKYINCGEVYEGEYRGKDKLTGEVDINGQATSDNVVGYFAYIELLSGFKKASYWSKEEVQKHAIRYNPECKKAGALTGNWKEHFDSRAKSTVLKHLITKYGIMSVEMTRLAQEEAEQEATHEAGQYANQGEVIDVDIEPPAELNHNPETGEVQEEQKAEQAEQPEPAMTETGANDEPGF